MKLVDLEIKDFHVRILVFGVCILEHDCEDEMELARYKKIRREYIRDIDAKGNIVDEEV